MPFSLSLYLSYLLYPPLYVTGPIICYEDFALQLTRDTEEEERLRRGPLRKRAMSQLASVLAYALALEVVLHYIHFHALSHNLYKIFHVIDDGELWLPVWEIMAIGFFMLNYMYLKFLVIWRAAEASAAMDLLETTGNMNRCVCNNYSFAGFWRSWHASLHAWILRYMYLPLGGKTRRFVTAPLIFSFIGLWHDLEIRWLAWALLNCACLVIEALVTQTARQYGARTRCNTAWWWRYLSLAASVANIYLLMLSNLAILYGFQGSYDFVVAFVAPPEPATFAQVVCCNAVACWWLVAGVVLMYEIREREHVAGKLKRF